MRHPRKSPNSPAIWRQAAAREPEAPVQDEAMRKALSFLAKLAVSGLLLYLALNWVDLGRVASRLSQIEPRWIALALLAALAQNFLLTLALANNSRPLRQRLPARANIPLHHGGAVLQPDAALERRRRRHAHLAGRQAGQLAHRHLFGAGRPRGRRGGARHAGDRLSALDACLGAQSGRAQRAAADRARLHRRRHRLCHAGVRAPGRPAALGADPPSGGFRDRCRRHPALARDFRQACSGFPSPSTC